MNISSEDCLKQSHSFRISVQLLHILLKYLINAFVSIFPEQC